MSADENSGNISSNSRILDTTADVLLEAKIFHSRRGPGGKDEVASGRLSERTVWELRGSLRFAPKYWMEVEGNKVGSWEATASDKPGGSPHHVAAAAATNALGELHRSLRVEQAQQTERWLERETNAVQLAEQRVIRASTWADDYIRQCTERVTKAEEHAQKRIAELEKQVKDTRDWADKEVSRAREEVSHAFEWSTNTANAVKALTPAIDALAQAAEGTKPETWGERIASNLEAIDRTGVGKAVAEGINGLTELGRKYAEHKWKTGR